MPILYHISVTYQTALAKAASDVMARIFPGTEQSIRAISTQVVEAEAILTEQQERAMERRLLRVWRRANVMGTAPDGKEAPITVLSIKVKRAPDLATDGEKEVLS